MSRRAKSNVISLLRRRDLAVSPIRGFGKFPKTVKPQAFIPMPFSWQFLDVLCGRFRGCRLGEVDVELIQGPFSPGWERAWAKICEGPESLRRYKIFLERNGLAPLKTLSEKACDPNFVLLLFGGYMWDESVPEFEHKDSDIVAHRQDLEAVQRTRHLFSRHTWEPTRESRLVEAALSQLENIVASYVNERDIRNPQKRRAPHDKSNRVMFTIYHHLRQRAGRPQWSLFLDLLIAAGAIKVGSNKRRKMEELVEQTSPDRRIMPHIRSFQKDHPVEAKAIPEWIIDWPRCPYSSA